MESPFDTIMETPETPVEPIVKQGGSSTQMSDDEINIFDADPTDKKEIVKKELAGKVDDIDKSRKQEKDTGKKAVEELKADEKKELQAKLKSYIFKKGENSLEIDEDFEFTHKINGKPETFKVKDLLNDFAGKTDWSRKYNSLHQERTKFSQERDTMYNRIQEFHRLAVEDKAPRLALEYLAESMGVDPKQFWEEFKKTVEGSAAQSANLTPEEKRAKELEQEIEHYRKRDEIKRRETEVSKQNQELLGRIKETQSKYGMNPEQFKACYDDMVAEAQKIGFDVSKLTPEQVGDYFDILNKQEQVTSVVLEMAGDDEKALALKDDLYQAWKANPQFTIEDIKDIATSVFGTPQKSSSRLAQKIKKEQQTTKKSLPQFEPLSGWDD